MDGGEDDRGGEMPPEYGQRGPQPCTGQSHQQTCCLQKRLASGAQDLAKEISEQNAHVATASNELGWGVGVGVGVKGVPFFSRIGENIPA